MSAGTKTLTIHISSNIAGAKEGFKQIRREIRSLVKMARSAGREMAAATQSLAIGQAPAAAAIAPKNIEKVTSGMKKAKKATLSWTAQINRLRGAFNRAERAGAGMTSQRVLKDMQSIIDKRRKVVQKKGGKAELSHMRSLENEQLKLNDLTRAYGIQQVKAIEEDKKRSKSTKETTKSVKADAKALRQRGLQMIEATKMNKEFTKMQRLQRKASAFGIPADEVKRIRTDIKSIMKDRQALATQIREERRMMRKTGKTGAAIPRIEGLSEIEHYQRSLERRAGGLGRAGKAGVIPSSEAIGRLQKLGMVQAQMIPQLSRFRSFVHGFTKDVKGFMSVQTKWFLSAAIIFAIPAAIIGAMRSFGQFEKAIKDIGAVTGSTSEELAMLSDEAKRVSMIAPVSAVELANMSKTLVQAGLSANQAAAAMETIAKVTTITGEKMDIVAQTFTTAIFAWKMSANESEKIGNIVAATLNYSRLAVEDLGTAYNFLAAVASQFNLSFEETNSIMASFSNLGIRASTIGTSLVQVITRITQKPPKEFKEFVGDDMANLVKIFESDSPTKFADAIEMLEKKGFNAAKAMRMFQLRAGRGLAAALTIGSKGLKEMQQKISETKQLTEGFETSMEATANQLTIMSNKAKILAITLGEQLKPVMEFFISAGSFIIDRTVDMASGFAILQGKWLVLGATVAWATIKLYAVAKAANVAMFSFAVLGKVIVGHPAVAIVTLVAGLVMAVGWLVRAEDASESFAETMRKGFADVDKGSAAMRDQIKLGKGMKKVYDEAADAVKTLEDDLKDIGKIRPSMSKEWEGYFKSLSLGSIEMAKSGEEIEALRKRLDSLKDSMLAIPAANEQTYGFFDALGDMAAALFLGSPGGPIAGADPDKMYDALKKSMKDVGEEIQKVKEETKKLSAEMLQLNAPSILDHVENMITGVGPDFGMKIEEFTEQTVAEIERIRGLVAADQMSPEAFQKFLFELLPDIKTIEDLRSKINKSWDAITDLNIGLRETFVGPTQEIENRYKDMIATLGESHSTLMLATSDHEALNNAYIEAATNIKKMSDKEKELLKIQNQLAANASGASFLETVIGDPEKSAAQVAAAVGKIRVAYQESIALETQRIIMKAPESATDQLAEMISMTSDYTEKFKALSDAERNDIIMRLDSEKTTLELRAEGHRVAGEHVKAREKLSDAMDIEILKIRLLILAEKERNELIQQQKDLQDRNDRINQGGAEAFGVGIDDVFNKWKDTGQQMVEFGAKVAQDMQKSFSNFFFKVMTADFENLADVLTSFTQSIQRFVADMLAQQAVMSFFKFMPSLPGLGFLPFATGGIMNGSFTPVRGFASGGISNGPTLGMIGEGRHKREAVVPLPDGRSIPVDMKGKSGEMAVTIINVLDPKMLAGVKTGEQEIINVISADILKDGQTRKVIKKFVR